MAPRAVLLHSRWQEPFGIVGLEALSGGAGLGVGQRGRARWAPGGLVAWGDLEGLAGAPHQAVRSPRAVGPRPGFERETLLARRLEVYAGLA